MVIITQLSRALFNQDRFKCGCKCTECCNGDACFTPTATRPCGGLQDYAATCKTYDKNQCGIEHSTATQAGFCSVAHPASWPALTIIPTPEERVNGTAEAINTPIGKLPTKTALDTDGLDIDEADLDTILSVDIDGWK